MTSEIRYSVEVLGWPQTLWFDAWDEVTEFLNQAFENEATEVTVKIHGY